MTEDGQIGELKPYGVELGDGLKNLCFKAEAEFYKRRSPFAFLHTIYYHRREAGLYVRGRANGGGAYDDIRITSRDQMRSLVRAAGLWANMGNESAQSLVDEITYMQFRRGWIFYWNTHDLDPEKREQRRSWFGDIMNPEVNAEWIRANWWRGWYMYLLWPLVLLGDAWSLLDTIQRTFIRSNSHPKHADDDHQIGYNIFSITIASNWIAKVNLWAYKRFRKVWPQAYDTHVHLRPRMPISGAQCALDIKYMSLNSPPFNEEWREVIQTYYERK